jgi:hypothetical protein
MLYGAAKAIQKEIMSFGSMNMPIQTSFWSEFISIFHYIGLPPNGSNISN